ncbi:MAG TPA: chemotaxis protein CheW [Kofleriaceae bacterium]|jgi:purine-binding chemotaxis protein CheW
MSRASDLRADFDASFARAPADRERYVELLAIRLGGEPYAVLVADITSVHADLEVVPLPASARELLGVAAIGTLIVPVYDLRAVVGAKQDGAPRWTVVAKHGGAAYAFDGFDGTVRFSGVLAEQRSRGLRGVIERGDVRVPVIDILQISSARGPSKEP